MSTSLTPLTRRCLAPLLLAVALPCVAFADGNPFDDWPQFRGRGAAGVAEGQHLPITWNVETWSNVRWRTEVPGLGHASPIVSNGRVFVVSAESDQADPELRVGLYGDIAPVQDDSTHVWTLYCLSQTTGQPLWMRTIHEGVPRIKRHTKATHANSTPATDGDHLVVFLGSEGLYCYDLCGRLLWKKDLGLLDSGYYRVPAAQWGFASSPIIWNGTVFIQCDVQQDSFLAAFDVCTGRELWRTPRDDVPTWSTPTVYEGPSRTELIVNGYRHAGGYNPFNGKELWKLSGGGDIPVPTPIVAHNLIFFSSAHGRQRPLFAMRPGATGEISPGTDPESDDRFAWYKPRDGIYMQTPLVYGAYLYACRDDGVLACYDARSGELTYRERLSTGTGLTASAVAADGKVYFTAEDGTVYVVAAGATFELLGTNAMNDVCMATPAIAGGMLYVRTKSHVYGIGSPRHSEHFTQRRGACTCPLRPLRSLFAR